MKARFVAWCHCLLWRSLEEGEVKAGMECRALHRTYYRDTPTPHASILIHCQSDIRDEAHTVGIKLGNHKSLDAIQSPRTI